MDRVILACLTVAAAVTSSDACSCGMGLSPRNVYCSYDAIVEGVVLAEYIERQHPVEFGNPEYYYLPYERFYVVRVDTAIKIPQKLEGSEKLTIKTQGQDNMCGARFPLDIDLTFFARLSDDGELWTTMCDYQTTLLKMATERFDCSDDNDSDNSGDVPLPPANECQTVKPQLLSKKDRHLGLRS